MNRLLAFKENDEIPVSFVSSQIYVTNTKKEIELAEIQDDKIEKTFGKILDNCYAADCKGKPATKDVSHVIREYINFVSVERDEMDNKIVETFSTKENIKQIYRYEEKEKEYWIIVEDAYSEKVDSIYEMYFSLLDEGCDYFEMRLISEDELSGFLYMKPEKIYGGL